MFKDKISNFILSRVDIGKVKNLAFNNAFLGFLCKVFSQSLIDYEYPAHIFIESTRACNLKCRSCPREKFSSGAGHMDFALFCKIIDEASSFGKRNFCLHMLGEPLLNPKIVDMVRYIKAGNRAHSVLLTTNGYFMDPDKASALIRVGLDKAAFSVFSLDPVRNGELTGRSDIDSVIGNIRNMADINRKSGGRTKIYIRFLACQDNAAESGTVRSLAKEIGVYFEERQTHNYTGVIKDDYTSQTLSGRRYPCYHPWFSPAITWDGKVVLCCSDWNNSTVLGDINREKLSEIWKKEALWQIRRAHLRGEYDFIPLCKDCNVWALYPDIFFKAQKAKK